MPSLLVDEELIVRRSPRARRLTLKLDTKSGAGVLTIPRGVALKEAMAFAKKHQAWLRQTRAALPPAIPFEPGQEIPVLGRPHLIVHASHLSRRPLLISTPPRLLVGGEVTEVSNRIRRYLRTLAGDVIAAAAHRYASQLQVSYDRIRLSDPTGRWGSCSDSGTLSFSWRLILAPSWVLDYVVAHEVAHLKEMNHSPRFWRQVKKLIPDPDPARQWLLDHGFSLHRIG